MIYVKKNINTKYHAIIIILYKVINYDCVFQFPPTEYGTQLYYSRYYEKPILMTRCFRLFGSVF